MAEFQQIQEKLTAASSGQWGLRAWTNGWSNAREHPSHCIPCEWCHLGWHSGQPVLESKFWLPLTLTSEWGPSRTSPGSPPGATSTSSKPRLELSWLGLGPGSAGYQTGPRRSCFLYLCLSFFICTMGKVTTPTSLGLLGRLNELIHKKNLGEGPAPVGPQDTGASVINAMAITIPLFGN